MTYNTWPTQTMKNGVKLVAAVACAFSLVPTPALAALQAANYSGSLSSVSHAEVDPNNKNVVFITFNDGVKGKITFLENGIFRYNVDPKGEFSDYATPRSKDHTARIQAQPDSSDTYSHPAATVEESGDAVQIKSGNTTISLEKATAKMSVKDGEKTVLAESEPLTISASGTTQHLQKRSGEKFFGGGTQNGRFNHTGETIQIVNTNNWVDGGVASPNPFYWSSDGYGVLRNTFAQGSYDFGKNDESQAATTHADSEFDAYYFVTDAAGNKSVAQALLTSYFKVTGNPVLYPEYGFYLGHLNAYNRDTWSNQPGGHKWTIKESAPSTSEGTSTYETGMNTSYVPAAGTQMESLNGHGPSVSADNLRPTEFPREFSAQAIIDRYQKNDMPLGWFLPNDGYGAGYGQNGYMKTGGVESDGSSSAERIAAVDANVENLKEFTNYANLHGVATGLWTQSDLAPDSRPETYWHRLRDFKKEVNVGGISTLKTDVAWVGSGYSFGLNGIKIAYDIATQAEKPVRPNIITLDGWAGTQRFGGIWTGDQTGGNWEYIRFHIPTYIGQSLSGNPNVGSDMDGIFGGAPIIATRDYQWKTFTPSMLDMDGWGSYVKGPFTHGDPYTGISRMYLKLKSQLMPYIYTSAASAANIDTNNGDTGLPMIRAMLLVDGSDYAASKATQYQYMFGNDFLVAPVYQNTSADGQGNDVRNNIYLPGTKDDIWIDYFTGKQYRGGQVLNNFDAPLWKLPLFVRANAIVPMYAPNNNPQAPTATNPKGLDKSLRTVEFFSTTGENSYTMYEDDGTHVENHTTQDDAYGTIDHISYGDHVSTTFTSNVSGDKGTFVAKPSTGSYNGYNSNRTTTFVVNVSAEPTKTIAKNGESELTIDVVHSQKEFDAATPEAGHAVYFYNEAPNLNTTTPEDEAFSATKITTTPKLYMKFAKTNVASDAQTLTVEGFRNEGNLPVDGLNPSLTVPTGLAAPDESKTPTSIKLNWDATDGATSYDVEVDGKIFSMGENAQPTYTHAELAYDSTHTYRVRARNAEGYSEWTEPLETQTLKDPWRNVPVPNKVTWGGGDQWGRIKNAFDHDPSTMFHSTDSTALGRPMTIDYGKAYQLDKFVYTPRQDNGGNGNIGRMKIETSLDGQHWTEYETQAWDRSSAQGKLADKTVNMQGHAARYLRLTPVESTGGFFSAGELALYKKDGTTAFEVGSNLNKPTVTNSDYQNMQNYLGIENRGYTKDQFDAQIAAHYADLNNNGIYDVYDYAPTMSKLDGGTTKRGLAQGALAVIPSASEVRTGDVISVDLMATDARNINAMGSVINFDSSKFELVKDSMVQSPYTTTMENLSAAKTEFSDGKQSVNLAFANRGDKNLWSGTGSVASFKLRALTDTKVELPSTSWLIGPTGNFKEFVDDGTIELPEKPTATQVKYVQNDFDITMFNDELGSDEGANVKKFTQQGHYNGLFSAGLDDFEFKWDIPQNHDDSGKLPSYIKLPTTIRFTFKQPKPLDNVVVTNRANARSNGAVQSIKAVIHFEDGSTQEISGDEYNTYKPSYTFTVDPTQASSGSSRRTRRSAENKNVSAVDIIPLSSSGVTGDGTPNRMLTLSEVAFNYNQPAASVESVTLGDNQTEFYPGDVSEVKATVNPQEANYPYTTVTSSDPAVASIVDKQDADGTVRHYVHANSAGSVTITVASVLDPSKTATYDISVKEGVDTAELQAAMDAARALDKAVYTEDTYTKLADALSKAEALLAEPGFTKDQVAKATIALKNAQSALKMRPVDEKNLINKDATGPVSVVAFSSFADTDTADHVLDYNDATLWHSSYQSSATLPQYLIFDLGADYDLTDITFLPRQNGRANGDIFQAQVLIGSSKEELEGGGGALLGTFDFANNDRTLLDRTAFQQMSFSPEQARFVMLKVTKSGSEDGRDNNHYTSLSEIRFYGTPHEEKAPVDTAALSELVSQLEEQNLNADDYTTETWTPFANALASAKNVLADAETTQETVDQALASLKDAAAKLTKTEVPPVENPQRDELAKLLEKAEATSTEGMSTESVSKLSDAKTYAKQILDTEDASEAQLKAAYDQLKLAIEGLTPAEPNNGDNENGGTENGGTENGGTENGGTENGGSGNGGTENGGTNNGGTENGGTNNGGPGNGGNTNNDGNTDGETNNGNAGNGTAQNGNNAQPSTTSKDGSAAGKTSGGRTVTPKTGDAATVAGAGVGLAGAITAALGAFLHKRRKN